MYKLKYLRESELLTQQEVAEKVFCGQRAYSYYERGERDIPTQTLIRIADFYNVSVDFILGRTENPKINR
ncbi:MAG: helix-turn-helix domain-containing protein [Oscillospiraceae bacterium]